ncbi:hypothetical protein H261_07613 [Paramagnetospirillum caucaseum]|uniref:Serine aminopeptidase S33 domain-containing protein n=1 Tax=Paramagnetospirillum caucaseum TaxID=1244869 RepID=M2YCA4_9PROT|nr:alpha/beta hydrolase [Paramagnetospirillum caucaseum]EME70616.1 hypothetical protein H261_07613 [Paramagnetospirillum caucaseum]
MVLAFLLAGQGARAENDVAGERALEIESRPGVTTAFYLTEPAAPPAAIAILLAGGDGSLGIQPGEAIVAPVAFGRGNFLVRSRWLLAGQGILVATMDAPSDQGWAMTARFRQSEEHAADIAALAAWLRRQGGDLPVWLIGTSMGTLSVASVASKLGGEIGGVILTSSITRGHPRHSYPPNGVFGLGLETVAVPAMVVAHAGDSCEVTPPADAPRLLDSMVKSPRRELLLVEGGAPARSAACQAMSAHGFFGRESEVNAAMAAFMRPAGPR